MKYTIQRLDGRFSFRKYFEYYIGFTGRMTNGQGPLHFNTAHKWFTDVYGWSAEVRQYEDMVRWTAGSQLYFQGAPRVIKNSDNDELPLCCNPHWSWTNGYEDLRIYVASDQELAFFQLSHPVDQ